MLLIVFAGELAALPLTYEIPLSGSNAELFTCMAGASTACVLCCVQLGSASC